MSDCFFTSTLPDYVLDRKIIINNNHVHYVNGYKLVKASELFKRQLIKLRRRELACYQHRRKILAVSKYRLCRAKMKNLSYPKCQPLLLNYPDIPALECLLSFIHCDEETRNTMLSDYIQPTTINSLLEVGLYFQTFDFINQCLHIVKTKINVKNCWNFWKASEQLLSELPEYQLITLRYLLANFIEAGQTEEFLNLNIIELKKLLKEDSLNSPSEKYLFNLIEKWINHKKSERESYITDLLKCLRLGKLSNEELDYLSKHSLIQTMWNTCSHIILMARISSNGKLTSYFKNLLNNTRLSDEAELYIYLHKPRLPHSAIFVIGGWEGNQEDPNFGPSKLIQVYNSRADTWRRIIADNLIPTEGHAYSGCILHNTNIYIIGGYVASRPTQTLKSFELITLTWKLLSPMHEKRNYVCTCSLDNYIYAIGGHNGRTRLNSVERYDIEQNQWSFIAPMHQIRSDAGAYSFSGCIYVVGGFDGHHFYNSVEMYNPRTDQWTMVASMHNIRSGVGVIVCGHYLYAIGGNDGLQRLRTVERYNADENRWQIMPSMLNQRSNFCVTTLDDMIYVIGGWSDVTNSTIASVERWSPSVSNHWESVKDLHLPASASCCCCVNGIDLLSKFI